MAQREFLKNFHGMKRKSCTTWPKGLTLCALPVLMFQCDELPTPSMGWLG